MDRQTAGCSFRRLSTRSKRRMMKVAPLALLLGSAHANTVKNMNGTLHLRYRTAGGEGREGGRGRESACWTFYRTFYTRSLTPRLPLCRLCRRVRRDLGG